MDNAIIQALRRARQAYMTNVGEPTAQLVGGGVRGYLGLDAPEYADGRGMEAYRNAQAIANTPVVGVPAMAARAGTRAAPAMAKALREHSKGFQEYNRALGPAGASQAIVWHGSPHKFDAFDSSKIGTGEGAQAYGHGLYLAESPSTAEFYKGSLTDRFPAKLDGRPAAELSTAQRSALGILNDYGGNVDSALAFAKRDMQKAGNVGAEFHVDRYNTLLDIKKGKAAAEVASPSLYKVDLPDEKIARMLDWDKPLSQQAPEVQAALQAADRRAKDSLYGSGGEYYRALMSRHAQNMPPHMSADAAENMAQAPASAQLRALGIPGIRYLDQGSRSNFRVQNTYKGKPYGEPVSFMTEAQARDYATEQAAKGFGTNILSGTSNFVVFPGEEAALTILERNNEIINALRKKKQQ